MLTVKVRQLNKKQNGLDKLILVFRQQEKEKAYADYTKNFVKILLIEKVRVYLYSCFDFEHCVYGYDRYSRRIFCPYSSCLPSVI